MDAFWVRISAMVGWSCGSGYPVWRLALACGSASWSLTRRPRCVRWMAMPSAEVVFPADPEQLTRAILLGVLLTVLGLSAGVGYSR
ncbi:Uncharacterised protein [Mycobacteroides abscessus subsp. abscessus]|nr:Uncharacterised protein [Mycobacteroides abscessus subsp. abscessus]